MEKIIYLNGDFVNAGEASVSPEDRGFNFADGVYEVVKYYHRIPFRMQDHLARLQNSLKAVKILPDSLPDLEEIGRELLLRNELSGSEAGIYMQITRGASPRVHHFPTGIKPTVYANAFAFPSFTAALEKGISVTTAEDIRWLRCDIKSVSLLPNTMLYNEAVAKGAGECILIRNGWVTEATHSSVFGVKEGQLFTHPLSNLILPGITRQVIIELCAKNQIPCMETPIAATDLNAMEELFIAGTGSEITPVVEIEGVPVSGGRPGKVTRKLQQLFFAEVDRSCAMGR